ncbi:hypothetical protein H6P81_010456 [Aristolochia fimbriata]|uniref:DUF7746 domain-containing protein n=1 Tax=Aristolochia fimbriata TaxID=158543 RepID=A0AAV7ERP0_ARIFI|nr:hypothetical protein H6P81_010456 [Aristolochia fimbriata]
MTEATAPQPLDSRDVEQITHDGKEQEWQLSSGTVIKSVFPPKDALTIQGKPKSSLAVTQPTENSPSNPKTMDILQAVNQVIRQNNYANLTLEAIEKQLQQLEGKISQINAQMTSRPVNQEASSSSSKLVPKTFFLHQPSVLKTLPPEPSTTQILEQLLEKIGKSQLNTITEQDAYHKANLQHGSTVNTKWQSQKPRTSRSTPFDLKTEENPFLLSNSYDARTVYEWNIDGLPPKQIIDTIHRMLIYSNVCRAKGMVEAAIVSHVVSGLSGDLYGWWYNYLTKSQRAKILNAVKRNESGERILDS